MFPTIFLSHGSPMLALTDCPARDFLRGLGKQLGRPSAIMVASAHWPMRVPVFGSHTPNTAIHDFSGFPPALFATLLWFIVFFGVRKAFTGIFAQKVPIS